MANVKISDLTGVASASGTQEFEVNDSGTSKKVTGSQLATFIEGEVSSSPTLTGQVSLDNGTNTAPSLTNTGDTNTGLYFPSDDTVGLAAGGGLKLSANASGIDVTGTVTADGLTSVSVVDTQGKFSGWSVLGSNGASGAIELGQDSPYQGIISYAADASTRFIFDNTYGSSASTFEFRSNTSATPKTHMKITGGGDISFYEDTGTTPKFFWDAAAESLGLGTSSPSATGRLNIVQNLNTDINGLNGIRIDDSASTVYAGFGIASGTDLRITSGDAGGTEDTNIAFRTASSGIEAERLRIDSSGNVGVTGGAKVHFGSTTDSSSHYIKYNSSANGLEMHSYGSTIFTNYTGTERMRIDSSGNLLVGKTSTNIATAGHTLWEDGRVDHTRDSSFEVMILNKLNNDGDIVTFRKDGSTVGSIGVNSSDNLRIAGASASHSGVEFSTSQILPLSANALSDNSQNIGSSSFRFKDLYLSGGVYLGGTGSANKLDDYEEGTWTPTSAGAGSLTVNSGAYYTKVGRNVTLHINSAQFSDATSTSYLAINGLPFAPSGSSAVGLTMMSYRDDTITIASFIPALVTQLRFYRSSTTASFTQVNHSILNSTSNALYVSITYQTA